MIVVTGATGNVGRLLVQYLHAAGQSVTAVSRGEAAAVMPEGVVHRRADLSDPASLKPALDGAHALFLLVAGEDPQAIVEAAVGAGVGKVVLLSSQGAGTRPRQYPHPVGFEQAVRASGLEWTVLRPTGFATNAYQWAQSVSSERTVAAPFGDVALPVVDPADIAELASAVLRGDGHAGRTYVVTGPEAISPRQQAQAIAVALGDAVRFQELTREEAKARLMQFMPEPVADGTLSILGEPTAEEQAVSPAVREVLGREPGSFADWARRGIAAFGG